MKARCRQADGQGDAQHQPAQGQDRHAPRQARPWQREGVEPLRARAARIQIAQHVVDEAHGRNPQALPAAPSPANKAALSQRNGPRLRGAGPASSVSATARWMWR